MAGAASRVDTATVLFTDVVGSTSQRARIGEEAADRLRSAHDMFVRAAIETNRGTVVKHTGDGVMATFSAAVDAVAAGVAIQQAVDLHNRRGETERIVVRIGISVGDVTFEGDDCFGLPVVEAQRLEAAADGGKILCADIVRHLARGRGGHEFVVHGDLELKGIPGTVPTAEVRWEPLAEVATGAVEGAPLPPALASPSAFPLSGRTEIFERLVAEWKESASGSRRVVLLAGEPGVGKTRLATELALVARDQDALVLAGRCDEDLGLAFQPFVEALRFQLELADEVAPDRVARPERRRALPAGPGGRGAGTRRGPDALPTRSPSAPGCSRRSPGGCARPPPRCRCSWCSTTCIGPTHRRSRCSAISSTRPPTTASWCSGRIATPTWTGPIRWPARWPSSAGSGRSSGSRSTVSTVTGWHSSSNGRPATSSTTPASPSPTPSSPRPRATRSSSGRSCATWWRAARSSCATAAGPATSRWPTSACPRACARWWGGGSPGSTTTRSARCRWRR